MREKLNRAIALMSQSELLEDQVYSAEELRKRLCERELIISVIGQFKRGKTSLINALLGDELLPVGIIPLTTAVTEIRRGDSFRAVVCFADGVEREVGRAELPDYISEQKNRDNHKNVAVVKLWTKLSPFGAGITLVDTPGVGSVNQHNTQTSHAYIEKSDAVLFLLSVDSPVSETERDFLLKANEYAAKFYFAVNKTDTVTKENLEEFLEYCKTVLSKVVAREVTLYPVSAKSGDGVSALASKLSADIRSSYDEVLEASVSIKLNAIIAQAKGKLALYLKAAAMPAEELGKKLAQIRGRQSRLVAFSDEVQVLTARQTERLVELIQEELSARITGLRPEFEKDAENLFREFIALSSRQFESKLMAGIEGVIRARISALNHEGLKMLNDGYDEIVGALSEKAADTARFVSGMVKEQFDLDYPVPIKVFSVSKRSDFYIQTSQNGRIPLDMEAFTHLLPKSKANQKIFGRALEQMFVDIDHNKNKMIYNYRYKMQESLRTLCAEFAADITRMSHELDGLMSHMEQGHTVQSEELRQTEEKCMWLISELDSLG